jgi:hypothetical protein
MCEDNEKVLEELKALSKTNNEILNTFIPELKRVNTQIAYTNKFLYEILNTLKEMSKK